MEKPTRLALLKEIAEFLNEETEIYSMMQGALRLLINGSDFSTGWIFYIDEEGHHDLVSSVDLPEALSKNHCYYLTNGSCWCVQAIILLIMLLFHCSLGAKDSVCLT